MKSLLDSLDNLVFIQRNVEPLTSSGAMICYDLPVGVLIPGFRGTPSGIK